jgi:hypothetical protein
MTSFDERKNALEKKFAMDAELIFKAEARCSKLFGHWIAHQLGLTGDDANAYASKIVVSNLEEKGFDDVKRAVRPDLANKNITLTDAEMDAELAKLFETAKSQIFDENAAA